MVRSWPTLVVERQRHAVVADVRALAAGDPGELVDGRLHGPAIDDVGVLEELADAGPAALVGGVVRRERHPLVLEQERALRDVGGAAECLVQGGHRAAALEEGEDHGPELLVFGGLHERCSLLTVYVRRLGGSEVN